MCRLPRHGRPRRPRARLTQVWASGRTDAGLFGTLRRGVPQHRDAGRGERTPDDEIWKMLAYLRTISVSAPTEAPTGNAANGERVFRAQCASCHRTNGRGGRLGPDLSRIGLARSRAVLVRRIRGAVENSLAGYEPVTVTTQNGQTVQGVKKNEDLFSVQVMDSRERIQGYLRSDVRDVADGKQSAMPVFGPDRLNESDSTICSRICHTEGLRPLGQPVDREENTAMRSRLRVLSGSPPSSFRSPAPSPRRPTGRRAPARHHESGNPRWPQDDGARWLTFGGNYSNHRFSPLTQLTPENVQRLQPQWTFQTGTLGNFETTTLMRDNVLYVTGPQNVAWAIDARTGRQIWRYRRELPPTA